VHHQLVGHSDQVLGVALVEHSGEDDEVLPLSPSLRVRRTSFGSLANHIARSSSANQILNRLPYKRSGSRSDSREDVLDVDLRVASAAIDRSICVFEAGSGELIIQLWGHLDAVWSVTFASTSTLFSSSADRTIRLWSIKLGACLRVLAGACIYIYFLNTAVVKGVRLTT